MLEFRGPTQNELIVYLLSQHVIGASIRSLASRMSSRCWLTIKPVIKAKSKKKMWMNEMPLSDYIASSSDEYRVESVGTVSLQWL